MHRQWCQPDLHLGITVIEREKGEEEEEEEEGLIAASRFVCSFTNTGIFFEEDLNISKKIETSKSTAHLEAQFVSDINDSLSHLRSTEVQGTEVFPSKKI